MAEFFEYTIMGLAVFVIGVNIVAAVFPRFRQWMYSNKE